MKLTIRRKLFFLVAIIITTYGLAVGFILLNFQKRLTEDARDITIAHLRENASSAGSIINGDFEIARTLATTLAGSVGFETSVREEFTGKVLEGIVKQNARYLSTWLSLELSAIDPAWTRGYGRVRYTYFQSGEPVFDTVNVTGDVEGSLYFNLKQSRQEELLEPYLLSSTSSVKDVRNDYLGTSVCVPLLQNDKFIGLAGMDITLEALDFIARIKPFPGAITFLISNDGTIVSHENRDLIGKGLNEILKNDSSSVISDLKEGKARSWISAEDDALIAFMPLKIGKGKNYWSIGTIVPMATITSDINIVLVRTGLISLAGLLILIVSVYLISAGITKPVNLVNTRLKELAQGHIRKGNVLSRTSNDEIGEMINSVNTLVVNMHEKLDFAVEIGNGKFDTQFTPAGPDDTLGIALQTMRNNLKDFRDEDEKRKWANEGLALLNDILRLNSKSNDEFYSNALRTVIEFLKANQGGLFVVVQDEYTGEKCIDLVASYAYEKKKFMTKRIAWGDNLIGQCIIEKEVTYLKNIPQDYIKITSGLGQATPTVVIIVPLKTDMEVVGALEIASFTEFQPHHIGFIEKASTAIASAISAYRTAEQTRMLLEKGRELEKAQELENVDSDRGF
jgi:methyl-accepting chemotaxis protein